VVRAVENEIVAADIERARRAVNSTSGHYGAKSLLIVLPERRSDLGARDGRKKTRPTPRFSIF
jgi:hypothetical protein